MEIVIEITGGFSADLFWHDQIYVLSYSHRWKKELQYYLMIVEGKKSTLNPSINIALF